MWLPKFLRRTPLALRQLLKEKTRLAVAVAGIAFADILMFAQMGFEEMLFDSTMEPQRSLNADLVMIDPYLETFFSVRSFSRERLYQTLAFEEVASVNGLYAELGTWKNPETGRTRTILVFGTDPSAQAFRSLEVNENRYQFQMMNRILFDRTSRPEFGAIPTLFEQNSVVDAEINNIHIEIAGLFTLGPSFAADGNVITSDSTFLRIFPQRKASDIEVGLINLKPGFDAEAVAQRLRNNLPNDVSILTVEEFAQREKTYWANATPIGFVFGLGVIVSFIVGSVIVYQILYSDVSDHLPEYATLKAMGYTDLYLFQVLVQEAILLGVLGYIPGFILAIGLYELTHAATLLSIGMTTTRATTVLILTIIMCLMSGFIAMRKLRSADPADIF
jgi:putative ABC transport system permease protein